MRVHVSRMEEPTWDVEAFGPDQPALENPGHPTFMDTTMARIVHSGPRQPGPSMRCG